jgi:O-acetyl-ADP-ribose deacetylase (regulator of RNase III)
MTIIAVNGTRVETVQGDITQQAVDAIVNAANETLLGGGGVDGAIHRAGGPAILKECRELGGCKTGEAKATTGGNLPAKRVIHTVGPIYATDPDPAGNLARCHVNSLQIALDEGLKTVAFPAISCGVYGYPIDKAAVVATRTVADFVTGNPGLECVRFVLFSDDLCTVFSEALVEVIIGRSPE